MDKTLIHEFITTMERLKKIMLDVKLPTSIPRSEHTLLDVIKSLSDDGIKVTTSAMSDILMISKPAISQTINALEKKGWVIRNIDSADKRVYFLTLTEEGINVTNEVRTQYLDFAEKFLEELGEEDSKQLINITKKIYTMVQNKKFGE